MGDRLGDGEGEGVDIAATPNDAAWQELARFTGPAYLRYSFTRGTDQEVGFLAAELGLRAGSVVLDVGCGPGRHAHALARRGVAVVGVDLAETFTVAAAREAPGSPATACLFARADARRLPVRGAGFDAVICLCQGGFGLLGGDDDVRAVAEMAAALRPGGRLALSAFSAYFAVRHLEEQEVFRAGDGVLEERSKVRDSAGRHREFHLSQTCFTPRELRLAAGAAGLSVEGLWSVAPGRYGRHEPTADQPEWLMVASRPGATLSCR